MSEYIKYNACDLDRLIQANYGKKFEVPYFMEGQRYMEVFGIGPEDDLQETIEAWQDLNRDHMGKLEDLEALMCDLCSKGLLEEGDYLLEFDD